MSKITPDKEHIFSLLSFLHKEVISSGGDGDALWYTRFFDLNDLYELLKEFNEINSIGWTIEKESNQISWGIGQEWALIIDSKELFDQTPDWYQIKIQY
jgi:hypothetical protein